MSAIQFKGDEFATFYYLEFDGFGNVSSTNPVEFHGNSATLRCTIQKSRTVSDLLSRVNKCEAFSNIWSVRARALGTGHNLQKNPGKAALPPVPTFGWGLGR